MNPQLSTGVRRSELERAIEMGLDFLTASQQPSGEFNAYVSINKGPWRLNSTTFLTSLVLYALGFVNTDQARAMVNKGLAFLGSQMTAPGLWRYWTKGKKHFASPPDLDDTCCISFLMEQHGASIPSNRTLILANRNRDGLFYTWLLLRGDSPFRWQHRSVTLPVFIRYLPFHYNRLWRSETAHANDIDCTVNANTLLYLGDSAGTDSVVDFLIATIHERRERERDNWYLHPFSYYYFCSRAYFWGTKGLGVVKSLIGDRILESEQSAGEFPDELLTALAVNTLLNYDISSPRLGAWIADLIRSQDHNGAWRKVSMWSGPKRAAEFGSEELTTALCLEALVRYRAGAETQL